MKFIKKHKAYILGLYAFLLLVHFVLKDNIFPISTIFYAAPLILIIPFGLLVLWLYRKVKPILLLSIFIMPLLIYNWLDNNYFITITKTPLNNNQTILFWNVAKKQELQIKIITNKIETFDPNIIALVETKNLKDSEVDTLQNKFKNYQFKKVDGEMLIGIKGSINHVYYKYVEDSHKYNYIEITLDNIKRKLLIADISASPFINKEKPLTAILEFSEAQNIDFLIGDFNTPYESVHFKNYHKNFNSFHTYGNGFTATWPYGIPLLELDQIWLNKKHQPVILIKEQYSKSDHKLLVAEYDLK